MERGGWLRTQEEEEFAREWEGEGEVLGKEEEGDNMNKGDEREEEGVRK